MAETNTMQVDKNLIDAVLNEAPFDSSKFTLEQLVVLINTDRVRSLEIRSKSELQILKDRYGDVKSLNDLRKTINNALGGGETTLDTKDPEFKKMLDNAAKLGVPVIEGKTQYSKEESERLLDNIKMTIEDLNVQNDLQMQQVSRLQNENHESFQLAMSIMRPLHAAKSSMIRGIAGGR